MEIKQDSVSPTISTVGNATLVRIGKLCVLSIHGSQYTVSTFGSTSVGTLPSDCIPKQKTSGAISCSLGSTSAMLIVNTDRTVTIDSGSDAIDNEYVYGQVVFLTTQHSVSHVILYDNDSGTTGTVTLSESAANFTFLEIYGTLADNVYIPLIKVYSPNGKVADLSWSAPYSDSISSTRTRITISGNSITQEYARSTSVYNGGAATYTDSDYIFKIKHVVGYR